MLLIFQVNDYFEKAVTLLPMDDCESGPLQEMYINIIREFGTHYTTEVVMGAKAVQQLTFLKSDLSKLESEGISAKVNKHFFCLNKNVIIKLKPALFLILFVKYTLVISKYKIKYYNIQKNSVCLHLFST